MKWILSAVAVVAGLAIAAMVALPRLVETPRVQSMIASSATQALARPVKFRSVSVSIWPAPTARLHGFEIAEDPAFGSGPFVRLDHADLRLRVWPLLRGHVEFARLVLHAPTISVVQGPGGRWNFSSLGAARETATVARAPRTGGPATQPPGLVSRVTIDKGLVTYERRTAGGLLVRQRLEDLEGTLVPRAGGHAFSGSGRLMPGELTLKVIDGTVGSSGARALTEATLRARVEVEGKDIGALVAAAFGPEPALGGSVTGRLELSGALGRPRAAGEIEVRSPTVTRTSPSCGEPRRRTLALGTVKASVAWRDGRLVVQPLTSGVGRGSVATTLVATAAPPTRAELSDLRLQGFPLERVLVDFLCQGYAVSGPLDLTGTLSLVTADPARTLSGSGEFRVGAGRIVGPGALALLGELVRVGGADAPGSLPSSPFDFDSITGSYQIANGLVSTRDLVYTSRRMKAKARGDYALPTGQVNADLVLEHGRGVLQARIAGPAASPSVRVTQSVARGLDTDRVDRSFKDLLKKFR